MRIRFLIAVALLVSGLMQGADFAALFSKSKPLGPPTFSKDVAPLVAKYCYACHGGGKSKGDLSLEHYTSEAAILQDRKTWEKVLTNLRTREMPPPGKPQPSLAQRELITQWIENSLFPVDCKNPDPGRVTIRRLNRAEYNNTIRDLVGVDFQPAADFPADDSGYGFDNIGDVLSVPPVLLEKYLTAADKIMSQALVVPPPAKRKSTKFDAKNIDGPPEIYVGATGNMRLVSHGEAGVKFSALKSGEHLFRIRAAQRVVGKEAARMEVRLDGVALTNFPVTGSLDALSLHEIKTVVPTGEHRLTCALLNPFEGPPFGGRKFERGFSVENVEVLGPPEPVHSVKQYPVDLLEIGYNAKKLGDGWVALNSVEEDDVAVNFPVTAPGDYLLRVRAYARPQPPASTPVKLAFFLDKTLLQEVVIAPDAAKLQLYEAPFHASAGKAHMRVVVLRNKEGLSAEEAAKWKTGKEQRGTVFVRQLEIEGPLNPAAVPLPLTHQRLIPRAPTPQNRLPLAREVLTQFAQRAYRRPVAADEIERLLTLVEQAEQDGESFEFGIKLACEAVLISPHFLFRGELQPEPNNPRQVHLINDWALASRLSYFLWSSMPDDALFAEVRRGTLRRNLETQVKRMLRDPKAQALVDNFAGQWLQLRNVKLVTPDAKTFPQFDETLRAAMQRETEMFFTNLLKEDRSVLEFLNADYTFVNERLARHYGLGGVRGEAFRKVSLRGTPRLGVLTHGSILTITSNPTRTSPVKRGKWILENILGTPPPPPPPNVPELEDGRKLTGTLRKKMEQHRENAVCASCHARMDPIGFGFENFDGVGAWRSQDGGFAIDPAGQLVSGESFQGAADLAALLTKTKADDFTHCLSEKMLTYALGRGLEYYDRCAVEQITKGLAKNQQRFSALILEIVKSAPFQMRRGEGDRLAQP